MTRYHYFILAVFVVLAPLLSRKALVLARPAPPDLEVKPEGFKHHILAFGDSLTAGYYDKGRQLHPYSIVLQEQLKDSGVKVHERGYSGERVVPGMLTRLPTQLSHAAAAGVKFEWVIIMGGINDLIHGDGGKDVDEIFNGLAAMYRAAGAHGARVLALTCMETNRLHERGRERDRRRLNAAIRNLPGAAVLGGLHKGEEGKEYSHVTVMDAERVVPFPHDEKDVMLHELWDDGLHLTPSGYDRLGMAIYQALKGKVGQQQAAAGSRR